MKDSNLENIDPEPIGAAVDDVMKSIERMKDKAARLEWRTESNIPASEEITRALEDHGYPLRHILSLHKMHGPSLEKAQALLPRVVQDCIFLLIGERGPGKTQMATWWAAQRLLNGAKSPGYYRKTTDLLSEIKLTWSTPGASENDVLKKYRNCHYLVLDEFGERGDSNWESRVLVNIIDHRYDKMLSTVIIANMNRQVIADRIEHSIISRAQETGGLIVCDWPSYRSTSYKTK